VYQSLRFRLIASGVVAVMVGLGVFQWLGTRHSERMLEEDLRGRAGLVAETVRSLWEQAEPSQLHQTLATLVGGQGLIRAIDIFRFRDGRWEMTETTRTGEEPGAPTLRTGPAAQLAAHETISTRLEDGGSAWRVAVPLQKAGGVVGAVQVETQRAEFSHLGESPRLVDGLIGAGSAVLVVLTLVFLLERRLTRPVAAVVDGMRRAERGDFGARVAVPRGGEFSSLARSFNSMLSHVETLTADPEARLERATRDLAAKNLELRVVNEKLAEAQVDVTRAERLAAHGHAAATIAHELGTPLNSVLGYTQLLLRDELVSERIDKLVIIESQVRRMADTMRDVLDQVRHQTLERVPVALEPLIAESLTLLSPRIDSRALGVQTDVPADLPPVAGDAAGLRQVLINLLTNAIDATSPRGTITVTARVLAGDGARACLELSVRDTGEGMTREQLHRAREPFYTTKAPGRGTGLGLAIVDQIVRAHQGRLVMESTPGQGTSMRVELPLEC
jgi:signal transduction histidine kinase